VTSDRGLDAAIDPSELAFNFRSGRLCLAFVATVGERWRDGFERLRSPSDLARWFREAGLVTEEIRVSPAGLESARELREGIHRQVTSVIRGRAGSRSDEALLNAVASHPDLPPVLNKGRVTLATPRAGAGRAALSTVARDAIDMFARVDPTRLRECASEECGLFFVDTSRPGLRRWCSSEACGGRARSAEYRRRAAGRAG
jgi:predicted RNA-binding Zn ribbon-like protein